MKLQHVSEELRISCRDEDEFICAEETANERRYIQAGYIYIQAGVTKVKRWQFICMHILPPSSYHFLLLYQRNYHAADCNGS